MNVIAHQKWTCNKQAFVKLKATFRFRKYRASYPYQDLGLLRFIRKYKWVFYSPNLVIRYLYCLAVKRYTYFTLIGELKDFTRQIYTIFKGDVKYFTSQIYTIFKVNHFYYIIKIFNFVVQILIWYFMKKLFITII